MAHHPLSSLFFGYLDLFYRTVCCYRPIIEYGIIAYIYIYSASIPAILSNFYAVLHSLFKTYPERSRKTRWGVKIFPLEIRGGRGSYEES